MIEWKSILTKKNGQTHPECPPLQKCKKWSLLFNDMGGMCVATVVFSERDIFHILYAPIWSLSSYSESHGTMIL